MKKIIIGCLIVLFVSSIVYAQNYEFSLTSKYDSAKQTPKKKTDWLFVGFSVSFFTLSILDLHSTYRGLDNGCKEINPIMAPIIDNKSLTIAVKMGSTFLVIYGFHQWKKRNKLAAYITFGVIILGQAYLVYHNYKIGGPRD